jgi:YidC/Oxa1 family membrane protein insertase
MSAEESPRAMQSNDPESQRNLFLAIGLSLAIILGWDYFVLGPKRKDDAERRQRIEQTQTRANPPSASATATPGTATSAGGATGAGAVSAIPGSAAAALTRTAALADRPGIKIITPNLTGSIALKGARIDDLVLAKYRETIKPGSSNVVLFSPAGTPEAYFAEYGWLPAPGTKTVVPGADTVWTAASTDTLTAEKPITLTFDNGQGLNFRRTIAVDDKFMFTIRDEVENIAAVDTALQPYARINRVGTPAISGYAVLHEGLIGILGSEGLKEITYDELAKEATTNQKEKKPAQGVRDYKGIKAGWLGITDKYWASALIPPQGTSFDAHMLGFKKTETQAEAHQTDYLLPIVSVAKGATSSVEGHLYAGAKEVVPIDAYQAKLGIDRFDKMIDWGWFYFITKPMFKLIAWFNNLFHNFGLAILAVTVLVKLAFFPLASKSYESMAKMKKLQPMMERIREQYKDDNPRIQQEMMNLYKTEKINPASGCMPMLLQIPVFFALYKVLFVTIDMRHAPFFGWIKDLSAPDPTSLFNLFGLFNFALPEFLHLGIWPILMGITMFVQMQLNPAQPDPMQQKIFTWMPVVFTFMMGTFPAGLIIYWAWSNLLSILQQYYIMQKNGAEIHLWKNMGLDKWLGGGSGGAAKT